MQNWWGGRGLLGALHSILKKWEIGLGQLGLQSAGTSLYFFVAFAYKQGISEVGKADLCVGAGREGGGEAIYRFKPSTGRPCTCSMLTLTQVAHLSSSMLLVQQHIFGGPVQVKVQ